MTRGSANTVTLSVVEHLETLPELIAMSSIHADTIEKTIGCKVTRQDLEASVKTLVENKDIDNKFYLTVRGPDDFSDVPYIWIHPKPPLETTTAPPQNIWLIYNPEGTATRSVDEGVLVFSQAGYAMGYMARAGFGDFNVETMTWQHLAEQSVGRNVVLDLVDGRAMTIIPFYQETARD